MSFFKGRREIMLKPQTLGISISNLGKGPQITEVKKGSVLTLQVLVGDLIVEVNGTDTSQMNCAEFIKVLESLEDHKPASLVFVHENANDGTHDADTAIVRSAFGRGEHDPGDGTTGRFGGDSLGVSSCGVAVTSADDAQLLLKRMPATFASGGGAEGGSTLPRPSLALPSIAIPSVGTAAPQPSLHSLGGCGSNDDEFGGGGIPGGLPAEPPSPRSPRGSTGGTGSSGGAKSDQLSAPELASAAAVAACGGGGAAAAAAGAVVSHATSTAHAEFAADEFAIDDDGSGQQAAAASSPAGSVGSSPLTPRPPPGAAPSGGGSSPANRRAAARNRLKLIEGDDFADDDLAPEFVVPP